MSTIKCTECEHENEPQRVYCHNCGARLDRSSLVEEAQKTKKPAPRVRNVNVSALISSFVSNLAKTVLLAVLVAAVAQAVRPPVNAPADKKSLDGEMVDAPSMTLDLEAAAQRPVRFGYTEAQLNAYLKSRAKAPKDPVIPASVLKFDSAFVTLGQGEARFTRKYLLFGQPCYVGGTYVPSTNGSALTLKNVGGNVGSLPLPAVAFDLIDDQIFADFIKGTKEEANAAAKMKSIEVTPKALVFTSGGVAR